MAYSLDKKWKEILYAAAGFGPNFLMTLAGAYFTDAVNPAALPPGSLQAISTAPLIISFVFPILWMVAKAFDGIVDVPLAAVTDSLSTKWGRRRPPIAVSLPVMMLSFAMIWLPFGSQTFNTIWIFIWSLLFFTSYTMCLISYYGSLSFCCSSTSQRMEVSSLKAFFDTISYCAVYALVPVLLDAFQIHIHILALFSIPLMLTMLIPLFLIKEGEKYGYPENKGIKEPKIPLVKSIKITFQNKLFRRWLVVNCCSFFGLQMFLVSMNALILGGMGLSNTDMAILNTFAFAPVPIMLYLFNKIRAKKGLRFGLQMSLLAFSIAILSFLFGNSYIAGDRITLKMTIGIIGSVIGSFAIGSFFMLPYMIPTQIASVEEQVTGRNHAAMYFAGQALTTSIVGAVAGGLVYENIKMLFIGKAASGIVRAETASAAAELLNVPVSDIYNAGVLMVPVIVSLACLVGFAFSFKMPRDFGVKEVAASFGTTEKYEVLEQEDEDKKEKESPFIQVALWVLSGGLFGLIWMAFTMGKIRLIFKDKKSSMFFSWILSLLLPFFGIFYLLKTHQKLMSAAKEKGVTLKGNTALYVVSGILLPLLPINPIALSLLTHDVEELEDR